MTLDADISLGGTYVGYLLPYVTFPLCCMLA